MIFVSEPSYNPYQKQQQCTAITHHICQDIFNCNQPRHQRDHLENQYHIPMSLLPDLHPSIMQTPSTASTLDSIKNFFNGGRPSKSMHRKRAHDNARNLEGNLSNIQPLLLDGQSEPLWRYPTNNDKGAQNRPNISSDYSVVYQPKLTHYEKTLRLSDCTHNNSGHDCMNKIRQGSDILHNHTPGNGVNSLLVDSSFSRCVHAYARALSHACMPGRTLTYVCV